MSKDRWLELASKPTIAHLSRSVNTTEYQVETAALQADQREDNGAIAATPFEKRKRRSTSNVEGSPSPVENAANLWMKAAADTAKARAAESVARRARSSSTDMNFVTEKANEWASNSPKLGDVVFKALDLARLAKGGDATSPSALRLSGRRSSATNAESILAQWKLKLKSKQPSEGAPAAAPAGDELSLRLIKSEGAEPSGSSLGAAKPTKAMGMLSLDSVLGAMPTAAEDAAARLQLQQEVQAERAKLAGNVVRPREL